MLETSVIEGRKRGGRSFRLSLLTLSALIHCVAFMVVVVIAAWNVRFPINTPSQSEGFREVFMVEPPPPPPPPPPPQASAPTTPVKEVVQQDFAPTIVPTTPPEKVVVADDQGVAGGVAGGQVGGVVGGATNGVEGGEVGGVVGGVIGAVLTAQARPKGAPLVIPRDDKLPMVAISQVYPEYPENERLHSQEGRLVVRYVIGKDGRVRQCSVVEPSSEAFNRAAVHAIRNWRFRPKTMDGEPVEVIHELTIFFALNDSNGIEIAATQAPAQAGQLAQNGTSGKQGKGGINNPVPPPLVIELSKESLGSVASKLQGTPAPAAPPKNPQVIFRPTGASM